MADSIPSYMLTFHYVDAAEVTAIGFALPIACLLIVLLRFFTRGVQKSGFEMDDWLIIAGLASLCRLAIVQLPRVLT